MCIGARTSRVTGHLLLWRLLLRGIRSFKLDGEYPQELLPEIQIPLVNGLADNTVSFGEDARGELYAVMASGRIYRVEVR